MAVSTLMFPLYLYLSCPCFSFFYTVGECPPPIYCFSVLSLTQAMCGVITITIIAMGITEKFMWRLDVTTPGKEWEGGVLLEWCWASG